MGCFKDCYLINPLYIITVVLGFTVLIVMYFRSCLREQGNPKKAKTEKSTVHSEKKKDPSASGKRKKRVPENRWTGKHEKHTFTHPWLLVSLKGHTGNILDMDFSSNGKYLTSCDDEDPDPGGDRSDQTVARESDKENIPIESSPNPKGLSRRQRKNRRREDSSPSESQKLKKPKPRKNSEAGAVFIWDTKDLSQKDRRSVRVNIEFDYATSVKWSPDSKAFIIHKFNENAVEVYKMEKKKEGGLTASKAFTFPKQHETDVISMGIERNGKFIITCSNETDLIIWDLKGQKLAQIDTYLINTTCAKISPCGRFIIATGFSPEAKVWEVTFNKSGEFSDVKSIKELTLGGHTSEIYDVAFDVDSSHMATVSKDETWHLYDTKVLYKMGENARLIKSKKYTKSGSGRALIALSPNAEVLAIATSIDVALYSTRSEQLDYVIEYIYTGNITSIMFDSSGQYLLTSGDKQIRAFHNVTGYRCSISTAKEKLKENLTSATRERLQKSIEESQEFLNKIENS